MRVPAKGEHVRLLNGVVHEVLSVGQWLLYRCDHGSRHNPVGPRRVVKEPVNCIDCIAKAP